MLNIPGVRFAVQPAADRCAIHLPQSAIEDRGSDHSLAGSAEAIAPHLGATLQFTSPIRAPRRGGAATVGLAGVGDTALVIRPFQ